MGIIVVRSRLRGCEYDNLAAGKLCDSTLFLYSLRVTGQKSQGKSGTLYASVICFVERKASGAARREAINNEH